MSIENYSPIIKLQTPLLLSKQTKKRLATPLHGSFPRIPNCLPQITSKLGEGDTERRGRMKKEEEEVEDRRKEGKYDGRGKFFISQTPFG